LLEDEKKIIETKYNKIIVQHDKPRIILHGIRDLNTMQEIGMNELDVKIFGNELGWEIIKSYKFNNIDEIINSCKEMNPIKNEGYVVVDKFFNRIKIKCPSYVE
jgi:hypothetical protein